VLSHPQGSSLPGAVSVHRSAPAAQHEQVVHKTAPTVVAPAAPQTAPASDSTVVDQSNGGMLAPDETDDTTTGAPAGDETSTSTTTTTTSETSTTTTGSSTTSGATSGPDGGPTGSTPPSAQGATAPGADKTPS
jgi:hypothetical protein